MMRQLRLTAFRWLERFRAEIGSHSELLLNSGAITLGNFGNAAAGFAYWWVAARHFTAEAVGLSSALVSTMGLIAQFGEIGLGSTIIGDAVDHRKRLPSFISAGLALVLASSLFCGALYVVMSAFFPALRAAGRSGLLDAGFIVGCGATGVILVFDQALIALLRSEVQLVRNFCFSLTKLALVGVAVVLVPLRFETEAVMGTWVTAQILSLAVAVVLMRRSSVPMLAMPAFGLVFRSAMKAVDHHLLNIAALGPSMALPLIVTVMFSAQVNAAFFLTWTIITAAAMVPAVLSTVLFRVMTQSAAAGRAMAFSLSLSLAFTGCAAAAMFLGSSRILGFFNPSYPGLVDSSLGILGLSLLGQAVRAHYIALMRIREQMRKASLHFAIFGTLKVFSVIVGGRLGGIAGFATGWVIATFVESVFMLPALVPFCLQQASRGARQIGLPASMVLAMALLLRAAQPAGAAEPAADFVRVANTQFLLGEQRFFITGVNNHYLTFGSEAEVLRVLDDATALGANVVRTFLQPVIGSPDETAPTIWNFKSQADSSNLNVHGVYLLYWDAARGGMGVNWGKDGVAKVDFLLAEARKRHLRLILAFLDFWDFTGGAQQINSWYGSHDKWRFFFEDPRPKQDYRTWVRSVIEHVNPLTGLAYRDDPTIFAWDLMNEPDGKPLPLRLAWIAEMAAYVKSLDLRHLLTSGQSNVSDALSDISDPNLDFAQWHGYPLYYRLTPGMFNDLIHTFCARGARYGKPVLLEEFGYARSNPDQAAVYAQWLQTIATDPNCSGWVIWRLVSRQDNGRYPLDEHDQFDIHNDGGASWNVLKTAIEQANAR